MQKLKNGRFKVTVSVGSGQERVRKSRTFDDKKAATSWQNQMDALRLQSHVLQSSNSLLTDAFDVFIRKYKSDLATATVASYQATLKMLQRVIPTVKLGQLSFNLMQSLFNRLKQHGLSNASLKKYKSCLSAAFACFERESLIRRNYVQGVILQQHVVPPTQQPTILQLDQYKKVMQTLMDMPVVEMDWVDIMMLIAFSTGLRTSETLDLRTDDIDVVHQTLRVDSSFCRLSRISKSPKSANSYRDVPASTELLEKALDWQAYHLKAFNNEDKRLILNKRGEVPDQSIYTYHFKKILKKILGDCPEANMSPHKARHTFISMMLSPEFGSLSVEYVAKISGHTVATLNSTYRHLPRYVEDASDAQVIDNFNKLRKGA